MRPPSSSIRGILLHRSRSRERYHQEPLCRQKALVVTKHPSPSSRISCHLQ
ncbi:uncharacterized protein DS421_17g596610 [Arachis hypogaea]|nr:uncharacterized protein DS421_17g596610 [Arachis hypogaea]